MNKHKRLADAYRFKGFIPDTEVFGVFGDPQMRIIRLKRRGKKRLVPFAEKFITLSMTVNCEGCETFPVVTHVSTWK